MAKMVYRDQIIEIKSADGGHWVDISDYVFGWDLNAGVTDLAEITLYLYYDYDSMKINRSGGFGLAKRIGYGGDDDKNYRLSCGDTGESVVIVGVDVSNWCSGYSIVTTPGDVDRLELRLQCDSDILRINGCFPWSPHANRRAQEVSA